MTTATETKYAGAASGELELATFYVGDLLMGIDIQQTQEINRQVEVTVVPHCPEWVRGVINLRGEVVTVLDLRNILGMEPMEITNDSRNIIVHMNGENIGLLVDKIADVVITDVDRIEPAPANISGIEGKFFKGVYQLEKELLVLLDINELVNNDNPNQPEQN